MKARVMFPDASGEGEWLEVEIKDSDAFIDAFVKASFLNAHRKGKFDRDPE